MHRWLQLFVRWLFMAFHDIHVHGAEHVPQDGPAIIASNHPTYLDPAFLMVRLRRPVRFMAWERPFRIPFLGFLMRAYGAIPVDMKKPGRGSFEEAIRVLRRGELFGIFPEGHRTKGERAMDPFRSGVVRLAVITGAPVVPATIVGGRRVWRRGQWFPKPGRITVHFHPPLRVASSERSKWRRDRALERGLVEDLMATIHRKLVPTHRRDKRMDRLLERAAPQRPRFWVEGVPVLWVALAALCAPHAAWVWVREPALIWLGFYLGCLALELALEARGWVVKWFRHLLPWFTLAGLWHHVGGWPSPGAVVLEAVFGAFLIWTTVFRFPAYRRVRTPVLVAAYGAWFAWVWRLL